MTYQIQLLISLIVNQLVVFNFLSKYFKQLRPQNFSHNIHLQIDINSPFGIKNLPEEWIKKFEASNISANDIKSDPKSVIKMIASFDE